MPAAALTAPTLREHRDPPSTRDPIRAARRHPAAGPQAWIAPLMHPQRRPVTLPATPLHHLTGRPLQPIGPLRPTGTRNPQFLNCGSGIAKLI